MKCFYSIGFPDDEIILEYVNCKIDNAYVCVNGTIHGVYKAEEAVQVVNTDKYLQSAINSICRDIELTNQVPQNYIKATREAIQTAHFWVLCGEDKRFLDITYGISPKYSTIFRCIIHNKEIIDEIKKSTLTNRKWIKNQLNNTTVICRSALDFCMMLNLVKGLGIEINLYCNTIHKNDIFITDSIKETLQTPQDIVNYTATFPTYGCQCQACKSKQGEEYTELLFEELQHDKNNVEVACILDQNIIELIDITDKLQFTKKQIVKVTKVESETEAVSLAYTLDLTKTDIMCDSKNIRELLYLFVTINSYNKTIQSEDSARSLVYQLLSLVELAEKEVDIDWIMRLWSIYRRAQHISDMISNTHDDNTYSSRIQKSEKALAECIDDNPEMIIENAIKKGLNEDFVLFYKFFIKCLKQKNHHASIFRLVIEYAIKTASNKLFSEAELDILKKIEGFLNPLYSKKFWHYLRKISSSDHLKNLLFDVCETQILSKLNNIKHKDEIIIISNIEENRVSFQNSNMFFSEQHSPLSSIVKWNKFEITSSLIINAKSVSLIQIADHRDSTTSIIEILSLTGIIEIQKEINGVADTQVNQTGKEEIRIANPVLGWKPKKLSPKSISLLLDNPFGFYVSYVLQLGTQESLIDIYSNAKQVSRQRNIKFGNYLHLFAEVAARSIYKQEDSTIETIIETISKTIKVDQITKYKMKLFGNEIIFFIKTLYQSGYTQLLTEQTLDSVINNQTVECRVDLLAINNRGGAIIIDYKSNKNDISFAKEMSGEKVQMCVAVACIENCTPERARIVKTIHDCIYAFTEKKTISVEQIKLTGYKRCDIEAFTHRSIEQLKKLFSSYWAELPGESKQTDNYTTKQNLPYFYKHTNWNQTAIEKYYHIIIRGSEIM